MTDLKSFFNISRDVAMATNFVWYRTCSLGAKVSQDPLDRFSQSLHRRWSYRSTFFDILRDVAMATNLVQTRNAWQSLAYSPLGAIVSPPSEYLWKKITNWTGQCRTALANISELFMVKLSTWTFGLTLTEASHQTFHIFTTRRYAKRGICRVVCLCVCLVCHTPVLYQKG